MWKRWCTRPLGIWWNLYLYAEAPIVKHFEIPRAPRSDCKVVRRKIEFRVREYRCIDYFQSATIFEMKNIKRNPNHSTHVSFVSVAAKSAKITPRTSPPSTSSAFHSTDRGPKHSWEWQKWGKSHEDGRQFLSWRTRSLVFCCSNTGVILLHQNTRKLKISNLECQRPPKVWEARPMLYRGRCLQVKTHVAGCSEIHKVKLCTLFALWKAQYVMKNRLTLL